MPSNVIQSIQHFESITELLLAYGIDETIQDTPCSFYEPHKKFFFPQKQQPKIDISSESTSTSPTVPQPVNATNYSDHSTLNDIEQQLKSLLEQTKVGQSSRHFILTHGVTENPDILVICTHPTANEEINGQAGMGKEYEFIDRIFVAAGLSNLKTGFYNLCPYRPAGERSLTEQETALCKEPLRQIISIISPRAILSLTTNINKNDSDTTLFSISAVQNMLKTPLLKQKTWKEIIKLKQHFNTENVAKKTQLTNI